MAEGSNSERKTNRCVFGAFVFVSSSVELNRYHGFPGTMSCLPWRGGAACGGLAAMRSEICNRATRFAWIRHVERRLSAQQMYRSPYDTPVPPVIFFASTALMRFVTDADATKPLVSRWVHHATHGIP